MMETPAEAKRCGHEQDGNENAAKVHLTIPLSILRSYAPAL